MNLLSTFSRLKSEIGRFRLLMLLILIVSAIFWLGLAFGERSLSMRSDLVQSQQTRLDELYRQSDEQKQQLHFLKVEMEIEKLSSEQLKAQLLQMHQENFKLQKDLAFYQKIMAPEFEADGVEIDQFHVTPSRAERVYHYKLVLVQTHKQRRFAKGFVNMTISGSQDNRSQSYALKTLVEKFDEQSLKFSFRYFQILEGDFTLPQGFLPQRVQVAAILPAGKWQKESRLDRQFNFFPEQAF